MNQYFYEDQVYTVDKKGVKFGLVVENEVIFRKFFLFSFGHFLDFIFTFMNYQFFLPSLCYR